MKKLFLYFAVLIPILSFSQPYSIDWYKIAGGGGTSTGGRLYRQRHHRPARRRRADDGRQLFRDRRLLGADFSGADARFADLIITHSGNSIVVSWPGPGAYTLQQNSNLSAPGGWVISGYTITTTNGTNSITVTPPTGNLFFRLKQ